MIVLFWFSCYCLWTVRHGKSHTHIFEDFYRKSTKKKYALKLFYYYIHFQREAFMIGTFLINTALVHWVTRVCNML